MSLIKQEDLCTLLPVEEVRSTADSAIADLELMRVAHSINVAANTGVYFVSWMDTLMDSTKSALKDKGYTVTKFLDIYRISWKEEKNV